MLRRVVLVVLASLGAAGGAAAQVTSPPGPWALDVRGVTSPVPTDAAFYPNLAESTLIPSRGFGLEAGAHVYLLNIGPSRLGIGASLFAVRAVTKPAEPVTPTTPPGSQTPPGSETPEPQPGQQAQIDLRMLTPQISFNFGTGSGWSYLSAGAGRTTIVSKTTGPIAGRREAEPVTAINVGGGARWFIKSRFGVGFDIRFHMVGAGTAGPIEQTSPPLAPPDGSDPPAPPGATPRVRMVTVSGGFSFK